MSLLVIYGANPKKVSRFSETLWSCVQALETIGKLGEVNGYVRMVLNKLEGIRFSDNRRWLARIEIRSACRCVAKVDCKEPLDNRKKAQPRKTDTTQTIETQNVPRQSKSRKEDLVSTAPDTEPINQSTGIKSPQSKNACRKQLNLKQLCFIVLERTTEPRSVAALPLTFKFCKRRHHSSIWERTPRNLGTWWWLLEEAWPGVSYRLVVVCVGGIQCRTPQSLPLILGTNEHYLTEDDLYERISRRRIEMMMQAGNHKGNRNPWSYHQEFVKWVSVSNGRDKREQWCSNSPWRTQDTWHGFAIPTCTWRA